LSRPSNADKSKRSPSVPVGFWEMNGYSSTAHPWRNDRYSRIRGL
jgi:hypothetical protein